MPKSSDEESDWSSYLNDALEEETDDGGSGSAESPDEMPTPKVAEKDLGRRQKKRKQKNRAEPAAEGSPAEKRRAVLASAGRSPRQAAAKEPEDEPAGATKCAAKRPAAGSSEDSSRPKLRRTLFPKKASIRRPLAMYVTVAQLQRSVDAKQSKVHKIFYMPEETITLDEFSRHLLKVAGSATPRESALALIGRLGVASMGPRQPKTGKQNKTWFTQERAETETEPMLIALFTTSKELTSAMNVLYSAVAGADMSTARPSKRALEMASQSDTPSAGLLSVPEQAIADAMSADAGYVLVWPFPLVCKMTHKEDGPHLKAAPIVTVEEASVVPDLEPEPTAVPETPAVLQTPVPLPKPVVVHAEAIGAPQATMMQPTVHAVPSIDGGFNITVSLKFEPLTAGGESSA